MEYSSKSLSCGTYPRLENNNGRSVAACVSDDEWEPNKQELSQYEVPLRSYSNNSSHGTPRTTILKNSSYCSDSLSYDNSSGHALSSSHSGHMKNSNRVSNAIRSKSPFSFRNNNQGASANRHNNNISSEGMQYTSNNNNNKRKGRSRSPFMKLVNTVKSGSRLKRSGRSNLKSATPSVVGVRQRNTDVDTMVSLLDDEDDYSVYSLCSTYSKESRSVSSVFIPKLEQSYSVDLNKFSSEDEAEGDEVGQEVELMSTYSQLSRADSIRSIPYRGVATGNSISSRPTTHSESGRRKMRRKRTRRPSSGSSIASSSTTNSPHFFQQDRKSPTYAGERKNYDFSPSLNNSTNTTIRNQTPPALRSRLSPQDLYDKLQLSNKSSGEAVKTIRDKKAGLAKINEDKASEKTHHFKSLAYGLIPDDYAIYIDSAMESFRQNLYCI